MFADRIVMARGSFLMIHCPCATMAGTADDLESTAGTLRGIEAPLLPPPTAARSGMAEAEVMRMMRAETWLPAERAVELGFADAIDGALARAKDRLEGRAAIHARSTGDQSDGQEPQASAPRHNATGSGAGTSSSPCRPGSAATRSAMKKIASAARGCGADTRCRPWSRPSRLTIAKWTRPSGQQTWSGSGSDYYYNWHRIPRGQR